MRRYQTATSLSSGGTAEVYKAWDAKLERHVALKFLHRDDPSLVERMFREARAQARLDHEGICRVFDVGELDGRPYIAMQYIDGVELSEAADDLTLEERVQVTLRVAEAVHYANQEGLIHRDLKPSNIMVQRSGDGQIRPVVVDFGLVHEHAHEGTAVTQAGQVLGTPPYLAPEQVEGRRDRLDRRTDVYGLGATFYELLTGRPPFTGERSVDLLIQTLHDDPQPPRRLVPSLPADLETIVLRCLEKEPQRRYDSARALAQDLRRYLDGEPIRARPASFSYRLSKTARKHRLAVTVAAVLLIAATLALAVVRWRADERLRYEQRFAQVGRDLDWSLRAVHMSARHDITPSKDKVRARVRELETELAEIGSLGEAPAHFAIGRAYAALGEDAAARRHLESAWNLGYRSPEVGYALGLVMGRQFERQLPRVRHLRDTQQRQQGIAELHAELRDPALRYLEAGRGVDAVATEYVEALLAFYEERYDEALEQLALARAKLPWLYETHIVEGRVLTQMGDDQRIEGGDPAAARSLYERAEASFRNAIASAPSAPHAYIGLCHGATLQMRLEVQQPTPAFEGYRQTAFEACEQALEIDGDLAEAHIRDSIVRRLWARHLVWTGGDPSQSLDEALASAQRAVELEPDRGPAHAAVANVLLTRGEYLNMSRSGDPRDDLEQATLAIERALELRPDNPINLNQLGSVWNLRGIYEARNGLDALPSVERAVAALEEAIRAAPRSFDRYHNLGNSLHLKCYLLYTRGREHGNCLLDMESSYRRATELNPASDWSFMMTGTALSLRAERALLIGEEPDPLLDEAFEWGRKALELNPRIAEFYYWMLSFHLQGAYFELQRGGDPRAHLEDAREQLRRAARINPDRLGEHARRLQIETLALRWAARERAPLEPILRVGDASLTAIDAHARDSFYYSAVVAYLVWRSVALADRGHDPTAEIERGLELTAEALERHIEPETQLLHRGILHFLASRQATIPAQRQQLLEQAESELDEALELNRWQALELDPWLAEVRAALQRGPRLEEAVD